MVPVQGSPIVHLKLLTRAGAEHNPPSKAGLANLMGVMLHQGNRRHFVNDQLASIDRSGSSLESGAGWDFAFIETRALASHYGEVFDFIAESLLAPTFSESSLQEVRQVHANEVFRQHRNSQALAAKQFARRLYGSSAYAFPLSGTLQSLGRIDRGDVEEFYRRYVTPETTCLVVVGAIDIDKVGRQAEKLLSGWRTSSHPGAARVHVPSVAASRAHVIASTNSSRQAELLVGHASLEGGHSDQIGLTVLGALLQERLTDNLRERRGLTYNVEGQFSRRRGPGPFVVRTAVEVARTGETVLEVLHEIRRLLAEEARGEELDRVKNHLIGGLTSTFLSLSGLSAHLGEIFALDLDENHFVSLPQAIDQVNPRRVLELANRYVKPGELTIVAAGDIATLRQQLEDSLRIDVGAVETCRVEHAE